MATSSQSILYPAPVLWRPQWPASPWKRLIVPSFSDCFFLAVLVWLFLAGPSGWKGLLTDGDTGWHIRTGEYVLDTGRVPIHDLFSFSKAGSPWFAWEWLSDVAFGGLFRVAGLKGVVLFSGVMIALFSTIVLRFALWMGANVMAALPLTLLAVGGSTIHFLARPHLFTLVLLPVSIWIVESDRRSPNWKLWCLIPLTALWTNLHGGFVVFLVCLALLVIGTLCELRLGCSPQNSVSRYCVLFVGCSMSTLANPFGYKLHVHIFEYLKADWIRDLVQEFQAPTFRTEGQLQFEVLLILGLMVAAILLARRRVIEAFWIVFLAHSALTSVRHAPLYAAVATPLIAASLSSFWRDRVQDLRRRTLARILYELGRDLQPAFRRATLWGPMAVAALACVDAPIDWPTDFPKEVFPVAVTHRNAERLMAGRVLTTDQWADYLIYSFYPRMRVFVDGRSDFYGESLGREYLALMQGTPPWEQVLDRYQFDVALIPVEWPLAGLLKTRPGWRVLEDDGRSILFARALPQGSKAALVRLGPVQPNVTAPGSRTYH